MSYSISTLLTRNLHDVFGENDPARRRAAIDEIFTEDCVYEPKGVHGGRDEIDRVAGAIKATHPDFRYQPIVGPEEKRWPRALERAKRYGVRSSCHLPLTTARRRLGILVFACKQPFAYETADLGFLQLVANQVAVSVENALASDKSVAARAG